MTAYEVTAESAGFSTKRLVWIGILMGATYTITALLGGMFWPAGVPPLVDQVAESIITGIFFALGMSFFIWMQFNFALEVSEESITVRRIFSTRKIRSGEVKTIVETRPRWLVPPGVRVSKHGRFGAWPWGGIWIPKALPEYEQLRSVVEAWESSQPTA